MPKYTKEYLQNAAKFSLGALDTQDKGKCYILLQIVAQYTGKHPNQCHQIIVEMSEGDFTNAEFTD